MLAAAPDLCLLPMPRSVIRREGAWEVPRQGVVQAGQERDAEAFLKLADGLAERRRRDA